MLSENKIRDLISAEMDLFEKNANRLPRTEDIKILKKMRAVWVLSGSGSYLKPLINTASDQANIDNHWYHATDKVRLDYAKRWLGAYAKILPNAPRPFLIYNGVSEQNKDLLKASNKKKYKIPPNQIYIAPGQNVRTLDQVKNFSFPPNINFEGGYLGVLSHAQHLARILRFMGKNRKIFRGIKVMALPLKAKNPLYQARMANQEIESVLHYIAKGEAMTEPYPYKLIDGVI